jgi:hypothetical protein
METPKKTGSGGDTMKDTIPASGDPLYFDSAKYTEKSIKVGATIVNYRAYEGIVYVDIRHGARDRDTACMDPINLYSKLIKNGYAANFRLAWDKPHGGDYDLDELFAWITSVTQHK